MANLGLAQHSLDLQVGRQLESFERFRDREHAFFTRKLPQNTLDVSFWLRLGKRHRRGYPVQRNRVSHSDIRVVAYRQWQQEDNGVERRKVGILGGMGPMATQAFYRELIIQTRAASDQDHLEVVIESDSRIPDRTGFVLGHGPDPLPALAAATRGLRAAGAEVMVMPCNTAQIFQTQLEALAGSAFVSWVDTAVEAAVAVARPPVAVLATRGTLEADIYGPVLLNNGLPYMLPSEEEIELIMRSIYEFKARNRATRS